MAKLDPRICTYIANGVMCGRMMDDAMHHGAPDGHRFQRTVTGPVPAPSRWWVKALPFLIIGGLVLVGLLLTRIF
jgi:hypothetical protein